MTKSRKSNSKGFTLIELLIVIIIIGILAAIAFVAYSGAQNKAHKSAAQSTLSEVKAKLAEYNADHSSYPATLSDVENFLASPEGGNNTAMVQTLTDGGTNYTYKPTTDSTGTACTTGDTVATGGAVTAGSASCSGFSMTAKATLWSGTTPGDDITVTN